MSTLRNSLTESQNKWLKNFLLSGGKITQAAALELGAIGRLASRINDLKNTGFQVGRDMIVVRNRDGKQVRVAEYRRAVEAATASQ